MASDTEPLASVVIPCYNQGRFLPDAIESARHQTHGAVEIIVVDDGSEDDTRGVARRYGVRCIRQRHAGAPAARNTGLRESRAEFLIFLDADDRLLPQAVAIGIEWLDRRSEWALVTGHVRLIAEDGSPAGIPPQDHADPASYVQLLRSNYIWTPGVVMYRRSVLDAVNAFDSSAGGSADYELNIRIARRHPIGCHHQVVLEYRRHRTNMSADVSYMLKSAVAVRRAQRAHVRGHPMAEQAWRDGIAIVQADFGGRLIDQVKRDLRQAGRRGRALRGLWCLIRYYPAGVLKMLRAGAGRLLPSA
jgi:glycosyltransferase involved in cell wall biosynthesis